MDRRKKEKELEDDLDKVAEHYLELSGEEKLEICEMMLKKMFSYFDNIIFDIDYKKSDYYDQMMLVMENNFRDVFEHLILTYLDSEKYEKCQLFKDLLGQLKNTFQNYRKQLKY
jgi:hypothetical protein